MSAQVLILRPEPGATRTAAAAAALGLDPVTAPLFHLKAVEWRPPPVWAYDAVILTSGNAVRLAADGLEQMLDAVCYVVGDSTARAALDAGFADVRTGPSDGAALIELMVADGVTEALHLCGREHAELSRPPIRIERRVVYASDAVETLPEQALEALEAGALALLHSPRAAACFAELAEAAGLSKDRICIAAISDSAAQAAGSGWKGKSVALEPRDHALLELAAKLCKTGGVSSGK
ncbi:MAG TPA: uroporphyrinogen-III synthase [Allosphingosinicella sp.]|jgi:uroporphyrinogen-III synthase